MGERVRDYEREKSMTRLDRKEWTCVGRYDLGIVCVAVREKFAEIIYEQHLYRPDEYPLRRRVDRFNGEGMEEEAFARARDLVREDLVRRAAIFGCRAEKAAVERCEDRAYNMKYYGVS